MFRQSSLYDSTFAVVDTLHMLSLATRSPIPKAPSLTDRPRLPNGYPHSPVTYSSAPSLDPSLTRGSHPSSRRPRAVPIPLHQHSLAPLAPLRFRRLSAPATRINDRVAGASLRRASLRGDADATSIPSHRDGLAEVADDRVRHRRRSRARRRHSPSKQERLLRARHARDDVAGAKNQKSSWGLMARQTPVTRTAVSRGLVVSSWKS